MTDIMEQRGGGGRLSLFWRDVRAFLNEDPERLAHECHGAERVPKAAVFGSREDHVAHAQLPDPAKPLHLRRADQVEQVPAGHRDEPVDGVRKEGDPTGQRRG